MAYFKRMEEWSRQRPVLAAVLVVAVFLLWQFPEWLGQVWPLFTDKKLPDVLAERGWAMRVTLPSLATIVVDLIVFVLLGFIIYQQGIKRRKNVPSLQDVANIEEIHALFRFSYEQEGAYETAYRLLESYVSISLRCEEASVDTEGNSTGNYQKSFLFKYLPGLLWRAILDPNRAALSALSNALTHSDTPDYGNLERIQELFAHYYRQYEAAETWITQLKNIIGRDYLVNEPMFTKWKNLDEKFKDRVREARAREIIKLK